MDWLRGIFPAETTFLVTGAAGFIGSHLTETLLAAGYRVRGFDNLTNSAGSNIKHFLKDPNFEFLLGDIRDFEKCNEACYGVNFVLHQAAWASVPKSMEMPLAYEEHNVKGTLNLLEAARKQGVQRFVYASSSSVYGDNEDEVKVEERIGRPLSPYALSKLVVEQYAELYSRIYGLPTYGLRYFNVFGQRQRSDGAYAPVVPKFIDQIVHGEVPVLYNYGQSSRDFTYVDNVVEANLKACFAPLEHAGEVFNVACGESVTVKELFEQIAWSLGQQVEPHLLPMRKGDIAFSLANIEKAVRVLGYEGKWRLSKGLAETIRAYVNDIAFTSKRTS